MATFAYVGRSKSGTVKKRARCQVAGRSRRAVAQTTRLLERFPQEGGKPIPVLSSEVMHVLLAHEWRGNGRELENLIERVVAFSTGGAVTDTDVQGLLHRSLAPPQQQMGIPIDLSDESVDLEGLVNGIEKISCTRRRSGRNGSRRKPRGFCG